ncbi:MAG: hypothetical protein QW818_03210 [Candidatus Aenigmatarchaeota archaeon]|nr:hypothetical protein [Candidatus Aenigmarchaeota archaeon]
MGFVMISDIPREKGSVHRQVHRLLTRIGAKQIQFSVWKHDKLEELIGIASFIKKSGGDARILEERFIF